MNPIQLKKILGGTRCKEETSNTILSKTSTPCPDEKETYTDDDGNITGECIDYAPGCECYK